jgi:hemerythrin-like domain-containing protein
MSGAMAAGSEMALVHNMIIRILNCIYLQAPNVKLDKDIEDFTTFMYAWTVLIHEHHGNEEKFFFPWLEEDIGVAGYMEKNIEQHHAFAPGMKRFDEYVTALRAGTEKFDGAKVRSIIDDFGEILALHLKEEIEAFEELERFGDKLDWKRWNKRVEETAVGTAEKVR